MPNGVILQNINNEAIIFKNKIVKDIFSNDNDLISSHDSHSQTKMIEETMLKEVGQNGKCYSQSKTFKDILRELVNECKTNNRYKINISFD